MAHLNNKKNPGKSNLISSQPLSNRSYFNTFSTPSDHLYMENAWSVSLSQNNLFSFEKRSTF